MILYNVTVNIEDEVHLDWLHWIQTEHIPAVLSTGLFTEYRMFRVLTRQPEEEGETYSIQYSLRSHADYELYRTVYAPSLQRESLERYGDRQLAFRTLLEEVSAAVVQPKDGTAE